MWNNGVLVVENEDDLVRSELWLELGFSGEGFFAVSKGGNTYLPVEVSKIGPTTCIKLSKKNQEELQYQMEVIDVLQDQRYQDKGPKKCGWEAIPDHPDLWPRGI